MKSIFILHNNGTIMYETNEYDFIIPRNVVIDIDNNSFSINRTLITLSENTVIYFVRDMSKKGLL